MQYRMHELVREIEILLRLRPDGVQQNVMPCLVYFQHAPHSLCFIRHLVDGYPFFFAACLIRVIRRFSHLPFSPEFVYFVVKLFFVVIDHFISCIF